MAELSSPSNKNNTIASTGYYVTDDKSLLDRAYIHQQIANTYWAKNIPLNIMNKAIDNSLCFGVFTHEHQQVGFARMITDKATFAYLADVFIETNHQQRGLAKLLMQTIQAHPDLQNLRRQVLATADAHGLYHQYGFKPLENPATFMENWQPNIYNQ